MNVSIQQLGFFKYNFMFIKYFFVVSADVIRIGTSIEHRKWNLENIKTKDFEVLWEHLSRGIKTGAYKPIPQHCFHCDDIQRAMGDLESMKGYHSKIVIKVLYSSLWPCV